jgi:hypothetical protein
VCGGSKLIVKGLIICSSWSFPFFVKRARIIKNNLWEQTLYAHLIQSRICVERKWKGQKNTSKTNFPTFGSVIKNCSSKGEIMLAMPGFEDMSSMPHNIDNSIFVKSLMPKEIGA